MSAERKVEARALRDAAAWFDQIVPPVAFSDDADSDRVANWLRARATIIEFGSDR